jgi:hypothetical protein
VPHQAGAGPQDIQPSIGYTYGRSTVHVHGLPARQVEAVPHHSLQGEVLELQHTPVAALRRVDGKLKPHKVHIIRHLLQYSMQTKVRLEERPMPIWYAASCKGRCDKII